MSIVISQRVPRRRCLGAGAWDPGTTSGTSAPSTLPPLVPQHYRPDTSCMKAHRVSELIERLGNLLRAVDWEQATREELKAVHIEMLRYLARANRYSDTPGALSEYLGLTKGTVSQSLLILERRGYLKKTPDEHDGRVVRVSLTEEGRRVVGEGWVGPVTSALPTLGSDATDELAILLEELLRAVQAHRGGRTFGVCKTCRFFTREGHGRYRCGLTEEPLRAAESELLCREHEMPVEG